MTEDQAVLTWNTYALYDQPTYDFDEARLRRRLETHHRLTGQWPLPPVVRLIDQAFPLADVANTATTAPAPGANPYPYSPQQYQQSPMPGLARPVVVTPAAPSILAATDSYQTLNRHDRRAAQAINNYSAAQWAAPIKRTGYNYCSGFSWKLAGEVLARPQVADKIPLSMRHDCRRVLSFFVAWLYHPLFNSDSPRKGRWLSFGTDRIREELRIRCDRVRINFKGSDKETHKQQSCLYALAKAGVIECHRLISFDDQLTSDPTSTTSSLTSTTFAANTNATTSPTDRAVISLEDVEQLRLDAAQLPLEYGGGGPDGFFHGRCIQFKANFYWLADWVELPPLAEVGVFNPFDSSTRSDQARFQFQGRSHLQPELYSRLQQSAHGPLKSEQGRPINEPSMVEINDPSMFGLSPIEQTASFEPTQAQIAPAKSEHLVMSGDVRTLSDQRTDLFDQKAIWTGHFRPNLGQTMPDSSLRSINGTGSINGGAGGAAPALPLLFKFAYNNNNNHHHQNSSYYKPTWATASITLNSQQKAVYHLLRQAHHGLMDFNEAGMGPDKARELASTLTAGVQEVAESIARWQQDWNSGLSKMHRPIGVLVSRLRDFDPTALTPKKDETHNRQTLLAQTATQAQAVEQARLARHRNFVTQLQLGSSEQSSQDTGCGEETIARTKPYNPNSGPRKGTRGNISRPPTAATVDPAATKSPGGAGKPVSNSGIRFASYLPGGKYNPKPRYEYATKNDENIEEKSTHESN